MGSAYISTFLVALDRLIVTTAIPRITDEFGDVKNVGWYGSAYLLTTCGLMLFFGKLYVLYSVRVIFVVAMLFLEIGSVVCGAAKNSVTLIVGRVIAGIGAGGVFSGAITVTVYALPLHRRPLFQGLYGLVFGLANVLAPLLGGAFTDNSSTTWRWSFYINLPLGGVSMVLIAFLLKSPDRETTLIPTKQKLRELDPPGTIALLAGITCLLIALEWGGTKYGWSEGRIIALLTIGLFLLVCFVVIQIAFPKTATVPPRVFSQRSIAASCFANFSNGAVLFTVYYFLPVWFQGIQGVSPVQSGIRLFPAVIGMVVGTIITAAVTQKTGYYTPVILAMLPLMAVGAGLLTTLQVHTSGAKWIGYQVPFGIGMGAALQGPLLAAQTVLALRDVPLGTSLVYFAQNLGGAVFVSVGQNLFNNKFVKELTGVPGIDAHAILGKGATHIVDIPEPTRSIVVAAYNEALRQVFIAGVILSTFPFLFTLFVEWRSVKKPEPTPTVDVENDSDRAMREATNAGPETEPEDKAVSPTEIKKETP
ncbi:putative MFS aflatoxin efflux pump [Coniochaeta sp. 2T2.1]|nr:putative MFS aflatoxin efflux pump [Coniochaeta sp. 2T2.1]